MSDGPRPVDRDESSIRFTSEKSIHAGLETLRRRRRWFWLLLLAAVPGIAVFMMLPYPLFPLLTAAWLGTIAIAAWYSSVSRCPRCGEHFHFHFGVSQLLTRQCGHCGLHLNADRRSNAPQ